jgi:hypothetical protein
LAAVFQSPLVGFRLQVALPAKTAVSAPSENIGTMAQDRTGDFMTALWVARPSERKWIRDRYGTTSDCRWSEFTDY